MVLHIQFAPFDFNRCLLLIYFKTLISETSSSVSSLDVVRESYYDYAMGGPDPVRPTDKTNQGGPAKGKAGVSQGAAVGIAIAFFFLAVVLTVVVMGFVLKRRGVSLFQFSRFHNEATA